MHHMKRMVTFLLAAVIMVSMLVFPAAALEEPWPSRFAKFVPVSTTRRNYDYTMAIQAFLCSGISDTTLTLINASGGMDGSYGPSTAEAVRFVQEIFFFPDDESQWDGKCGPATWRKVGECLYEDGTMNEKGITYTTFCTWDCSFYRVRPYNSGYEYAYNNLLGDGKWHVFRRA